MLSTVVLSNENQTCRGWEAPTSTGGGGCHDEGYREEGEWALNIKSVIIFGRIRLVEEQEKSLSICRELCFKFTDDEEYIQKEIENAGKIVQFL